MNIVETPAVAPTTTTEPIVTSPFQTPHEQAVEAQAATRDARAASREASHAKRRAARKAEAAAKAAAPVQHPQGAEAIEAAKVIKKVALRSEPKAKTKKVAQSKSKTTKPAATGRDAFGGRIGTRMSKVNLVVINAGKRGATVAECAKATGESASLCSAQLGWVVSTKKGAIRKELEVDGKKTYRYWASGSKTAEKAS